VQETLQLENGICQ